MRYILFATFLLFFMTGCSANGPIYSPAGMENGKGQIYVYRPGNISNSLRSSWVTVNGDRRYGLKNSGYHVYDLPAGKHSIRVGKKRIEVDLESGESKYVRYRYGWALFNVIPFDPGQLKEVADIELAKSEIVSLKLSM